MRFNRFIFRNLLTFSIISVLLSCKKDEDTTVPVVDGTFVELKGNLSTQTLDASKKYLLKGFVFVGDGQTLTIPAGTIIFGDKASKSTLIINRGGKIIANGTAEKPIVFTSKLAAGDRDQGDWGGVIILGNANVNKDNPAIEGVTPAVTYGTFNSTANDNESSGSLKYVRIEFAGIAISPDNEINGLTFGGVGRGTIIENVQVSYSGDDAIEWFGGTVNAKNLVCLGTWDDDFDTDFGFTGNVQFGLVVRDPGNADKSGSNAFESDNDGTGTTASPQTAPIFSNVTVFGPRFDSLATINSSFTNAVHFRRNTATSLFNSVLTGFPTGILLDGSLTYDNYKTGNNAMIQNNLLISLGSKGAPKAFSSANGTVTDSIKNYFNSNNPKGYITKVADAKYSDFGLDVNLYFGKNASYPTNPNFAVSSGVISSGANFSSTKLTGGFFQSVDYHGAFGASDWTDSWTNFDPKNTTY